MEGGENAENAMINSHPWASVGVDVIVGFPGETDSAFIDTYTFLADLDISYLKN